MDYADERTRIGDTPDDGPDFDMDPPLLRLTPEQKAEYVKKGGVRCPYCDNDMIEGGPVQIDGSVAWQEITCLACDRVWGDIYTLSTMAEINDEE